MSEDGTYSSDTQILFQLWLNQREMAAPHHPSPKIKLAEDKTLVRNQVTKKSDDVYCAK